MVLLGRLGKG